MLGELLQESVAATGGGVTAVQSNLHKTPPDKKLATFKIFVIQY